MAIFVAIGAAIVGVALLFLMRPKSKKPDEFDDLENPVAEAGKPIPVAFGTITVKGLNVLWYGDKTYRKYKVSAGK